MQKSITDTSILWLLSKKDYKIDDEISIKEYSRGVATGKEMTVRVKNILKDCTGIEDAYCVIGF